MSSCSCWGSLGVVAMSEFVDVVYSESLGGTACAVVGFLAMWGVSPCSICIGFRPVFCKLSEQFSSS